MKKVIFLVILIFFADTTFSQIIKPRHQKGESRLERLEKLKLIEALELDEETTLKFFSRRTEHRRIMHSLQQKSDDKMFEIENILSKENISEAETKKLFNEYLEIERSIHNERMRFFSSLSDILTYKQINKIVIFERKFRQELKDVIIKERQRRNN